MRKYSGFLSKVARSGFYIILFLCISAIGISGYVMYLARDTAEDVRESIETKTAMEIPFPTEYKSVYNAGESVEETIKTSEIEEPQEKENEPEKEEKEKAPAPKPKEEVKSPEKKEAVYTMALAGAITAPFSGEELVKSKTMEDWRIHAGVDIKGDIGAEVRAIADGEVISVEKDNMLGNVVRINHGDGMCSIYANLGDEIAAQKGARVRAGDKIGVVGQSALCECMEPPHLHLEVTRGGKNIDPLSLFPEGKE